MMRRSFAKRNDVRLGLVLASLVVATAIPAAAFGADKMVLGELFTNTG